MQTPVEVLNALSPCIALSLAFVSSFTGSGECDWAVTWVQGASFAFILLLSFMREGKYCPYDSLNFLWRSVCVPWFSFFTSFFPSSCYSGVMHFASLHLLQVSLRLFNPLLPSLSLSFSPLTCTVTVCLALFFSTFHGPLASICAQQRDHLSVTVSPCKRMKRKAKRTRERERVSSEGQKEENEEARRICPLHEN